MKNKLLKGPSFLRMKWFFLACIPLLFCLTLTRQLHAETLKSDDFAIQIGITPTPKPFTPKIQVGFPDSRDTKPLEISLSTNLIDYGPLNPTNPIKRQLNISIDAGSSHGFSLFAFEDHPLRLDENIIPDTTCDTGSCTQKNKASWINPFTFGLGFSFDDKAYQQFADFSNHEIMEKIEPGKMIIKLNINQNQPLAKDKNYENSLIFLVLPKY